MNYYKPLKDKFLVKTCTLLYALILIPSCAYAFFEDICYEYTDASKTALNPVPFNCWDVQCKDNINHSNTQCVTTGLEDYLVATLSDKYHARNTLHFDVVWLLARMLGMKSGDASTLAYYSEATDPGGFTHYDYLGNPIASSTTDSILGVQRTNLLTSGYWFHYIPWYKLPGTGTTEHLTYTPGAVPSPFSSYEVPLNHLRAWAFGKRDSVCEFGLTKDINSDTAACINDGGGIVQISVTMPFMAFTYVPLPQTQTLSWQRINPSVAPPYNCDNNGTPTPCYYEYNQSYASSISGTLKALGIYLHAMDDRLSHFACVDPSPITPNGSNYVLQYGDTCGQATHALLHYEETGHSPVPERSVEAITYSYYEIQAWIAWKKTQPGGYATDTVVNAQNYPAVSDVNSIAAIIGNAIARGISRDRVKAMCKLAVKGYNLGWHDGNSECKY